MAAKERVLELVAEKRRALITRAVTRGLDPRAPLRDSGIPWLGEIPAHWELERGEVAAMSQSRYEPMKLHGGRSGLHLFFEMAEVDCGSNRRDETIQMLLRT